MDANGTDHYMKAIKKTSREFQNAFVDAMKKKVKEWGYSSEGSYYHPAFNEIKLTVKSIEPWTYNFDHNQQTLFHEVGHAIDNLRPGTNSKWTNKKEFLDAMLTDMKAINDKVAKGDFQFIIELNKLCEDDNSKGVQDALSAMKCKGIGLTNIEGKIGYRWHHSQEYWERKDAKKEAASELFANMCGAQVSDSAKDYMKEYFPNAYKEFWNIINEIGK